MPGRRGGLVGVDAPLPGPSRHKPASNTNAAIPVGSTSPTRSNEEVLEIAPEVLTDGVIEGLVNDWIVPMIVDRLISAVLEGRDG
jgi:hypothetical protein